MRTEALLSFVVFTGLVYASCKSAFIFYHAFSDEATQIAGTDALKLTKSVIARQSQYGKVMLLKYLRST